MTIFEDLQGELALSLLGEDWKKKHAGLAAKDPHGDWVYHQSKIRHHKALAKFHNAAMEVSGFHPEVSAKHNLGTPRRHLQLAKRHEALLAAHEKLGSAHKPPPFVPGTLTYAKRKSENP